MISFNRGLPQGDPLCPRFTAGYRLSRSRPVGSKVTDLMYIDDLKVLAASQAKLDRELKMTKEAIEDIGLQWNPKKCNVLNVRRGTGVPVDVPEGSSQGRRSAIA